MRTWFLVLGSIVFLVLLLVRRLWWAASLLTRPVRRRPALTPSDLDLEAEPTSFKTREGLTLRGWFIPARGRPKGTIVLSHGYAGDCSPDLIYAPLFRDTGYNTFYFDYRGHGTSDGDYTSLVYFERGDLLAALELLKARGIEKVGLIGFSMGGAVVLAAAPLSPMVVGVISDSAFSEVHRVVRTAAQERGIPSPLADLAGWTIILVASIRLRANLFSADPIRWIDKIAPRPVLLMHGAADRDVPPAEAERLFRAAREPKELWIVPGAGHRKIEDVAPEEYRQKIVEFFDRAFDGNA